MSSLGVQAFNLVIEELSVGSGTKHKVKSSEKQALSEIKESKKATLVAGEETGEPVKKQGKKEKVIKEKVKEPKEKKEKKTGKNKVYPLDSEGNSLKKPLSGYMLFNNFRRPLLQTEHPGKCRRLDVKQLCRVSHNRSCQISWLGMVLNGGSAKTGILASRLNFLFRVGSRKDAFKGLTTISN